MSWGAGDTGNAGISFTEALGAGVAFGGWVGIAVAGIDLILSIFGIDPISLIEGAITGLPTFVKTMETGQRLANSKIPIVAALGVHFANLAHNGHYLSSTPDLEHYFGPAMKYTTSCLYGYEPTPINHQMQGCVFSGAPVKPIDTQYLANYPGPPQLISQTVFEHINPGHAFPTGFHTHLQKVWDKLYPPIKPPPPPPQPPQCPPGTHWDSQLERCVPDLPPPPPQPPQCPPGTHWDSQLQQCVPDYTPPPPVKHDCPPGMHWDSQLQQCVPDYTPPPPPPPHKIVLPPYEGPPPDDGSQDELSQIGQCLCSGINWIIAFIQQVAQQPQDDCCKQIVAALSALNGNLIAVFNQLAVPEKEPPPPDFSGIIAELKCLCTAAQQYPAFVRDLVVYLSDRLEAVAKTIVPPVDLTPVSDAINKQTTFLDVPTSVLQQLAADARIPEQYKSFLQGTPWATVDAIINFLGWVTSADAPADLYKKAIDELPSGTRIIVEHVRDVIDGLLRSVPGYAKEFWAQIYPILVENIQLTVKAETAVTEPLIKPMVDAVISLLKPTSGISPTLGNIGVDPDGPIAAATGIALSSGFAAWFLSYVGIDAGEPLTKIAEYFAAAVGYEELRDVLVGPYVRHGIAAVADMQARSFFRQHLPRGNDVAEWMARGLVTSAFGKRLLDLDGFGDEIQPPTVLAAQRGLNPRMLLQLIQTGLFSEADLRDELTFAGIRPASQSRLTLAAPYLATRPFRDTARSAIEGAYVAGLLSDSDLTEQLDSIEHNTDRDSLVLIGAKWRKLSTITKDLEAQYATLFEAGLIDDATLHDHLTAIGLQSDVANAVAARSEARANAALQRRTIADARQLARATAGEERRAAVRSFVAGKIDLAELAVALTATGLTPVQAAAWSEIAQLQKAGSPRWSFGLRLPAAEATLLRERVTALLDQRKRQLLSDPEFHDALLSLRIPPEWINALRATANAMVTPKAAATLTPIETGK